MIAAQPLKRSSASVDLFDALPIAVAAVDASGLVTEVNAAAQRLFPAFDLHGLQLETLISLTGASGGRDLLVAIRSGQRASARIQLADQRVINVDTNPTADGGSLITLFDVSAYIQEAELSAKDPLTGLFNRAGFTSRLNEALAEGERSQTPIAVLCIDLDRFKNVNDSLGHPIGDALLIKVADRLRSAARKGDIIGRMGGDEFAIIAKSPDPLLGAEALAARLVDLIGRGYVVSGHHISIGASIGVSLSSPDIAADAVMKQADLALYSAKEAGRGQFRFFEAEMDAQMQRRRLMELDLRRALALREFQLVFQPQYSLGSDELTGFEALIRWHNAARGLVSPADFIPLAEEIGLMVPIGEWVMREACRQAASWSQPVSVAVNLSAAQFQGRKLVQTVASALAGAGLEPARLEIEITETALLEDTDVVLETLQGIRALGVKISMDDFGTGYSSLSYLQKFPFHKIKIDQSFVRRMSVDDESKAIVRAVAALGASLGMTTTAEGVETPEQLNLVREEGCTHVQGYLTGKPMSSQAAAELTAKTDPTSNPEL